MTRKKKKIQTQRKRDRSRRISNGSMARKKKEILIQRKRDRNRRISNERVTRKEIQTQR